MNTAPPSAPLVHDELELLAELVPLADQRIVELGCGAAQLARALLQRYPGSRITALEVDERQHAKNLAQPQERSVSWPRARRPSRRRMPASTWR